MRAGTLSVFVTAVLPTTHSNVQAHHRHSGGYCYQEEEGKGRGVEGRRKKLPYVLSNMEEPKQCSTLELLLVSTSNAQVGRNVINITELSPHLLRFRGLTGLP